MNILICALSLVVFVSQAIAQDAPQATTLIEAELVHLRSGEVPSRLVTTSA